MARITWQNVSAPDTAQSVYAIKAAGDLLKSGFSGLGGVASGLDQRQRDALSNEAVAAALRSGSRSEFDKIMGADGLKGFGVADPGRLNADAMSFFQGRRSNLADLDNTTSLTAYRDTQRDWFNKDKQFQYDERAKAVEQAEAEDAADAWARQMVQGMGDTLYSADAARQTVLNSDYTPEQEARLLAAIGQAPYWKASGGAVSNASVNPMLTGIAGDIDTLESNYNFESNANPLLRYYNLGSQRFDNLSAAGLKVANSLRDLNADEERIGSYASEINTAVNEISREMGLPPEVVAAAVEENLTSRNWLGWEKDTLQIDRSSVIDALDGIADQDSRQLVASQSANVKKRAKEVSDYRNDLQAIQDKIALAETRGDSPEQMRKLEEEATRLSIRLSDASKSYREASGISATGGGFPGEATAPVVTPAPSGNRVGGEDALFGDLVFPEAGADYRAARINQDTQSFVNQFQRGADRGLGQVIGALGSGFAATNDLIARGVSTFDQNWGTEIFQNGDEWRKASEILKTQGYAAGTEQGDRVREEVIPNLEEALRQGIHPMNGRPLTAVEKKKLEDRIKEMKKDLVDGGRQYFNENR